MDGDPLVLRWKSPDGTTYWLNPSDRPDAIKLKSMSIDPWNRILLRATLTKILAELDLVEGASHDAT